jgi:V-type H+-transporting ATPase subunit a
LSFDAGPTFRGDEVFLCWAQERSGGTIAPIINRMETDEIHPTYNKTNRFTKGFQNLVDAYGIAEYKEMNPGR